MNEEELKEIIRYLRGKMELCGTKFDWEHPLMKKAWDIMTEARQTTLDEHFPDMYVEEVK
jgi:hypothetical protein